MKSLILQILYYIFSLYASKKESIKIRKGIMQKPFHEIKILQILLGIFKLFHKAKTLVHNNRKILFLFLINGLLAS